MAAVSRRRKPPSPSRSKTVGMEQPALSTTAASTSRTGRPSLSARAMAMVVLPLPGMPMRTRFSLSRRREAVIFGITLSGMSVPVKSSAARWAWATSIQSPPAQGMPRRSACRRSAVRAGL